MDDAEKKISGTLHEAAYNHEERSFSLKLTYTYGKMPGSITYVFKGAYIKPDGIESITAGQAESTTFNLFGQRVTDNAHGIVIRNGRKIIR